MSIYRILPQLCKKLNNFIVFVVLVTHTITPTTAKMKIFRPKLMIREEMQVTTNSSSSVEEGVDSQAKKLLGEKLYPLVKSIEPTMAEKITGMLLELHERFIHLCINDNEYLSSLIKDAVALLENEKIKNFAEKVTKRLERDGVYTFRRMIIDDIHCQPMLYLNPKVLNIESVHVKCNVNRFDTMGVEDYSIYNYKYKNVEGAIRKLMDISKSYKILDGDLCTPGAYEDAMAECELFPYAESQKCSVCYTSTADVTKCGHHICFKCRQSCIMRNMNNCPECREPNVMKYYHIDNGLINNECHINVAHVMEYEIRRRAIRQRVVDIIDEIEEDEEAEEDEDEPEEDE
uniref:RING-type domain-containing protein n=1 Tax=viral metagenome TaxID=1070528 RepID=A0A6C0DQ49_9ZZZZ